MAAPLVELRHYSKKYTLTDAENGLNYLAQMVAVKNGDGSIDRKRVLYAPPILQFRFQVKTADGAAWTDWYDVPVVREGIEDV